MSFKMIPSFTLFSIFLHSVNSDMFITGVSSSAPSSLLKCTTTCEKTFPLTSNKIAGSECCSRGCRFYGIAELVGASKQLELNISREACHNCCHESYSEKNDRAACSMGCDTMARLQQEISGLVSAEISWTYLIGDGDGPQIVQAGELLEPDDVLTDPALKRQLIIDLMEDKLPVMRVKTLPVSTNKKGTDWWSDCSDRRDGIPRCLAASLFMLLIVLALWLFLSYDEKSAQPSPPVVFNSDQAPPLPPKYSLLDDLKV